jgi:hypothetical protein
MRAKRREGPARIAKSALATGDDDLLATKHWFLDLLDSIASAHELLYCALNEAGYAAIRIERLATHPVWEIRATLPPNAPVADRRLLKRQLRVLLKAANLPVKSDDIIVMPAGRRVHVKFVQEAGSGVVMRNGVATIVEDNAPDPILEYDE